MQSIKDLLIGIFLLLLGILCFAGVFLLQLAILELFAILFIVIGLLFGINGMFTSIDSSKKPFEDE